MLLDNPLEDLRGDRVIPNPFGIYHCNWTLMANAQAVGLRAVHAFLRLCQAKFFQALFQKIPRLETFFLGRASRFGLVGTEENVAADVSDFEVFGEAGKPIGRFAC